MMNYFTGGVHQYYMSFPDSNALINEVTIFPTHNRLDNRLTQQTNLIIFIKSTAILSTFKYNNEKLNYLYIICCLSFQLQSITQKTIQQIRYVDLNQYITLLRNSQTCVYRLFSLRNHSMNSII